MFYYIVPYAVNKFLGYVARVEGLVATHGYGHITYGMNTGSNADMFAAACKFVHMGRLSGKLDS